MDQHLEQQIRLADSFIASYFAALSRLRHTPSADGVGFQQEPRETTLDEAASTVGNLLATTEAAKASARALGMELGPAVAEAFDPPVSQEEQQRIKLAEALGARADLRALQSEFPGVNWSDSLGGVDTDLFSSKRKNLLVISVSTFAVCGSLAIFYPVHAFVIAMISAMLLGKAYVVHRKYLS